MVYNYCVLQYKLVFKYYTQLWRELSSPIRDSTTLWPILLCPWKVRTPIQQKWDGYFNLAMVISVPPEWHHITPTSSDISHILLRLNACVQCVGYSRGTCVIKGIWHVMGKQPITVMLNRLKDSYLLFLSLNPYYLPLWWVNSSLLLCLMD